MNQKFAARERFEFANGAIGWRPGGPFDCLGPYAKVQNCPIDGTPVSPQQQCPTCFGRGYVPQRRKPSKRNPAAMGFYARNCSRCAGSGQIKVEQLRLTCYATGYPDTYFSVPACTRHKGKHVSGFFMLEAGGCVFVTHSHQRHKLA